jgi:hypothetical protein
MKRPSVIILSLLVLIVVFIYGPSIFTSGYKLVSQSGAVTLSFLSRDLQYGSTGEDVKELQRNLSKYPEFYPEGEVTGFFGRATERAIQKFQDFNKIVTGKSLEEAGYGKVGPKTREKLNEFFGLKPGSATPSPVVTLSPKQDALVDLSKNLPWTAGKETFAISLSKNYLTFDESDLSLDLRREDEIEINVWFYTSALVGGDMILLSKGKNYSVGLRDYGKIFFMGGDYSVVTTAQHIRRNVWHRLGVKYKDSTSEFFLDGKRIYVRNGGRGDVNDDPLILGGMLSDKGKITKEFEGIIDEVSISRNGLEVFHLNFNEGKGITLKNLINNKELSGASVSRRSSETVAFFVPEEVVVSEDETSVDAGILIPDISKDSALFFEGIRVNSASIVSKIKNSFTWIIDLAGGKRLELNKKPIFQILSEEEAKKLGSAGLNDFVPAPNLAFTATQSSIDWNGETTLVWRADGADTCLASGDWSGNKSTKGEQSFKNLKADKKYGLACTGKGGTSGSIVNIFVSPEPPVLPKGAQQYSVSSDSSIRPRFIDVSIDPLNVSVGDTQTLRVKVFSEVPVTEVIAETELDHQNFRLPLVRKSGDSSGEIFEASWEVFDTIVKEYKTVFTATDANGDSNNVSMAWVDPCSGISDTVDSSLGTDCSVSAVDGIDGANLTIPSGRTLTLNDGATFVWNPGKSITANGSIVISKTGSGGKLRKGYLFYTDSDGDGRPANKTTRYFNTEPTVAGYVPVKTVEAAPSTYPVDANESSASCWQNLYADTDGDGYGAGATVCVGNEAGYVSNNSDCSSGDGTKWQNLNCYTDADGDGWTTSASTAALCTGSSCGSPNSSYRSTSSGVDCNDANGALTNNCYDYGQGYYYGYGYGYGQGYYQDYYYGYGYGQGYYYGYGYGQGYYQDYYYGYGYGYGQGYYYGYGYGEGYYQDYYYGYGYGYGEGYYYDYGYGEGGYYGEPGYYPGEI